MKRINFLSKLYVEEKLKLVEPSEEIKESYMRKSKKSLLSATILLENKQIEDAVPLAYYSMYSMLTALLYKVGVKCENHAGAMILLKELFQRDNSKIKFAKTERVDKQDYINFKITKEDVESLIEIAKEFNGITYDFIEHLTSQQSAAYRDELRESVEEKEKDDQQVKKK